MNLLVNDAVEVIIKSVHGTTVVTGNITQVGLHNTREDVFYFQIAGLTSTFWSDEISEVRKVG